MDDNGSQTTTDVHISVNGTAIFNDNVNLNVATMHYASLTSHVAVLAPGDTIDFSGCGGDACGYDSTSLNAVIEAKFKRKSEAFRRQDPSAAFAPGF